VAGQPQQPNQGRDAYYGFYKRSYVNPSHFHSRKFNRYYSYVSGADTAGWIDVVGDEAGTLTHPA
jgi:hypothetical protein